MLSRAFTLHLVLASCVMGMAACAAPEPTAHDTQIDECVNTASAELRVCASGPTLKGIDVSSYQQTVDWTKVKTAGISFAFARVSDGTSSIDGKFAANWPAMKAAGIVRGAYQYFRPSKDATEQVNLFIQKVDAAGGLEPGDLPPVLDLETTSGLSASVVVAKAKEWLAKIEAHYGVKPIIYTGNNMSAVTGTHFSSHLLWVPNYTTSCPSLPSGWTDWAFWQHSDKGSVNGVPTAVDTNFFNGTVADLQAITAQAVTTTPPAPTADDPEPTSDQGEAIGSSVSDEPEPPPSSVGPCR
jgi:lysozyme